MNCKRCGETLSFRLNSNSPYAYTVSFYGGDRTRDGQYCATCAVADLEDELVTRSGQLDRARDLAKIMDRRAS